MLVLVHADNAVQKLAEMMTMWSSTLTTLVNLKKTKSKLASVVGKSKRRRRPRTVTCSSEELRRQIAGQDPIKLYARAASSITDILEECKQAAQLRVDASVSQPAEHTDRVPQRPRDGADNAFLQRMWDNLYGGPESGDCHDEESGDEDNADNESYDNSSRLSSSNSSSSASSFSSASRSRSVYSSKSRSKSRLAVDVRERLKEGKSAGELMEAVQDLTLGA